MLRRRQITCVLAAIAMLGMPGLATAQTTPVAPPEEAVQASLAERAPDVARMLEALRIYEILEVMAAEGIEGAMILETDMFPEGGGAAWAAEATRINGADRIIQGFEEAFPADALSPEEVEQVVAFFTAEPGLSIAAAEVAGRTALLDDALEERATDAFIEALSADDPRIDLLSDFIEANDLIERNVSGALNSNFAFYRGLSDGGAFEVEIPEELMLTEVWGQETDIRRETIEWLYSFQLSSYAGLSDGDIEAYTAFSLTPAGQALNAALFQAFDVLFEEISYDLGFAAAKFIAGEDA